MNGEGTIHVRMLDEAIQSAVALTGEASLRCLKYLWPRSRRYELDRDSCLPRFGPVRSSPFGGYRGAPKPPEPLSAGRTLWSGSSDEAPVFELAPPSRAQTPAGRTRLVVVLDRLSANRRPLLYCVPLRDGNCQNWQVSPRKSDRLHSCMDSDQLNATAAAGRVRALATRRRADVYRC